MFTGRWTALQCAVGAMNARSAGAGIRRAHMFVDERALGRATRKLLGEGPHPAVLAFLRSTELFLNLPPARAAAMPQAHNLFVVQNCLLELSLIACIGEEDRHVEGLGELMMALDPVAASTERLPEEVHWSFVLVGLAVALDLAGHLLSEGPLRAGRDAVESLGERLHAESLVREWGEPIKRRAAWNHAIVAYAGMGAAGLAIPGHASAREWVTLAIERSLLFFEHGITAAGMTREGLAYCGFVFRNLGLFLRGARATGVFDYLDPAQNPYLERLARVPDWYAGEIFPRGGWMQNLNSSYWDPNPALVGWLATFPALRPELAAAVWRRTVGEDGRATFGLDPKLAKSNVFESLLWHPEVPSTAEDTPSFYHCPDVGYLRERADSSQTGFSFNSGEYIGSIHDHSDNNAFTLFAHGVPIALDAGACSHPPGEGNSASSFGHNTVVVDGRGQLPAGHGSGVSGEIVYLDRDEARLIVAGDARRGFMSSGYNPVLRAIRWCVFVSQPDPYLLIYDDIQKDQLEHTYEFLLHTPSPSAARVEGGVRMTIEVEGARTTCDVAAFEPETISVAREPFACPGHPPFEQHALWRFARRALNPEFVVLLIPVAGSRAPQYQAELGRAARSLTISVRFGAGHVDRILLPRGGIDGPAPSFSRRRS